MLVCLAKAGRPQSLARLECLIRAAMYPSNAERLQKYVVNVKCEVVPPAPGFEVRTWSHSLGRRRPTTDGGSV